MAPESGWRAEPRFFDSHAAYMMFVTTATEKAAVAAGIARELPMVRSGADALRVFDAGMGNGSVLANVMRNMHESFTHVPWLVVGKEISVEDVRETLDKLPDRLHEHSEMVFRCDHHDQYRGSQAVAIRRQTPDVVVGDRARKLYNARLHPPDS